MGVGSSSVWEQFDPRASKGYPEGKENLQALAGKAAASFPPPFRNLAQEGPVETAEGNRAWARGYKAVKSACPNCNPLLSMGVTTGGYPSKAEMERELGGPDGFFTVFACHYMRMFANPRMSVLFDSRHPETNVSALEHGKRVACALLDKWYGTDHFRGLGNPSTAFFTVTGTHKRAKRCPMRPKAHQQHARFTTTQRDTWIGSVICGAEDCGASEAFQAKLGHWLARNIDVYAPFEDDYAATMPKLEAELATRS